MAARLEAPAGDASAAAALRRLVGYVATDGVEREETYEAWGSSDEEGILDRQGGSAGSAAHMCEWACACAALVLQLGVLRH